MDRVHSNFAVSTDYSKLDLKAAPEFLKNSYWAKNIPFEVFEKCTRHSLCFGVYDGKKQVGFARAVTDFATYAYVADVFILEEYRGLGLSKLLMESIMTHPELQGLRRWSLVTRDAHGLYRKFGFTELQKPERYMEILRKPYPE
jgi:GNAT superfamily N-acetyltransferase